ncbi:D-alanyl-D-alanine carboxypeptidase [bacterium D16-54]|nr:D-alanyl-D-alanine carboxypeptidase [bacterium D16-54]RKJ11198.1 D-alanyl-D-alanine carboxypeptidase [bacterium D16-56]
MGYSRLLLTGVLSAGLILTGCGQKDIKTDISYPMQERMNAMTELFPPELMRAETFAEDLCVVTTDVPQPDSSVGAEAAAVFSLDDHRVILEKNVFERLYPASTTKVMTALIAIRYGNLQDMVTVGQETVITEQGASLCHIRPGETLTMEQLLYGLMMPSGNDAGAAIAVYMAGSIEGFAEMMNQEARAVGATDTHFVNPHGLHDEDHYTTAYDLYLIFQEAMKEPVFRQIVGTGTYTAEYTDANGEPKTQTWNNSNQFLTGQQPMPQGLTVLGGKTGTTSAAGSCLIMGSQDMEGHEYVSVVMKAENRQALYQNMTNIIQKIVN